MEKRALVRRLGMLYSEELGIRLAGGASGDVFRWFLASVLFGAPIGENSAKRTFFVLDGNRVNTPEAILKTGWDGLVRLLDSGGYTRYDFKTADKLLEMARSLRDGYGSDLNLLYRGCGGQEELEARLCALAKGIGPITVDIFLREMQGVWRVRPKHTPAAVREARRLGVSLSGRFSKRLEAALVRHAHIAGRGD